MLDGRAVRSVDEASMGADPTHSRNRHWPAVLNPGGWRPRNSESNRSGSRDSESFQLKCPRSMSSGVATYQGIMPRRTTEPPSPPDGYRRLSENHPDAWPLLVAFDLE